MPFICAEQRSPSNSTKINNAMLSVPCGTDKVASVPRTYLGIQIMPSYLCRDAILSVPAHMPFYLCCTMPFISAATVSDYFWISISNPYFQTFSVKLFTNQIPGSVFWNFPIKINIFNQMKHLSLKMISSVKIFSCTQNIFLSNPRISILKPFDYFYSTSFSMNHISGSV